MQVSGRVSFGILVLTFIFQFLLIEMKIIHFITMEQKSSTAAWLKTEMLWWVHVVCVDAINKNRR